MSWNYHAVEGSQAKDAMNNINNWVNNKNGGYCSKFASADMQGKVARAVVFYSEEKLAVPDHQPTPNTKWSKKSHSSSTNYDSLYRQAVDDLNHLKPEQQFYSSIMFTNAAAHDAVIDVIYPSEL